MRSARPTRVLVLAAVLLAGAGSCLVSSLPARAPLPERAASGPSPSGLLHRNLANLTDRGIPADFSIQKGRERNIRWAVPLGTMSFSTPVVAGGRIFVGTNNERP